MQALFDRGERRRPSGTPVLPREKAVPVLPQSLGGSARPRFAHQRQIGDRQSPARPRLAGFDAVAVAEGVELLDIAQSLAGLSFDPGAQSDLERTVLDL